MDEAELKDMVKAVGLPMEQGDNDWTIVHFLDGRSYQIPMKLSDCAVEILEQQQPRDDVMRILGYRMPDIVKWIEPVMVPIVPYMPWPTTPTR